MNHLNSVEIACNHLIFVFKKFEFFSLIYKDDNFNQTSKSEIDENILLYFDL